MAAISPEKKFAIHRAVNIDGLTFNQAAKFFHVSSPVEVKAICEEVSKENEDRFTTRADYQRDFHTERMNEIYLMARREFDESKKPTRKKFVDTITRKKKTDDGDEYDEVVGTKTRTVIEQNRADPRWANTALAATETILDANGWKVPKQLNVSQHHLHDVQVSLKNLSREELKQIASLEMLQQQGVLRIMDKNVPKPVEATVIEKKEEAKHDATPF
jgi:hypothetical protein